MKSLIKYIKDLFVDGYRFVSVLAPLLSISYTLAKLWGIDLMGIQELSYTWAFLPLLIWVLIAYTRKWRAFHELEEKQKPRLEIVFKNEEPYFQDDQLFLPGKNGKAKYRFYRIRIISRLGTYAEGVEVKVSEIRYKDEDRDILKGSSRNLNLTHDKILPAQQGQTKEYEKEFSLKGDSKGRMANVIGIPISGDPNPYFRLMDIVSNCCEPLEMKPLEIDVLAISKNCPSITKTFEIYELNNQDQKFGFREKVKN